MNRIHRGISILALCMAFLAASCGQSAADEKAHTFHGKVEAVHKDSQSLTVNGEKVEGWMGAMTMDYKVDDPSILDKLKPGDQITATVYDGDYSLHKVRLAGNSKSRK